MKQQSSKPVAPDAPAACLGLDHGPISRKELQALAAKPRALDRAAALFRALGDPARLRLLVLLEQGERCVSELVDVLGEKFPTVSQRLRLLRTEGLVVRRRDGNHLHYALADRHVADLVITALEHAAELVAGPAPIEEEGG
jgi:ArsR family transcriptional regulator